MPARFQRRHRLLRHLGCSSRSERQKMPPVWNQRAPSLPKIASQSISPRLPNWLTAVCPRSRATQRRAHTKATLSKSSAHCAPRDPRRHTSPKSQLRDPPRPAASGPRPAARSRGLSASAVTIGRPQAEITAATPRATLYSPPPSHAWNVPRRCHAQITGVEPQHHLAQASPGPTCNLLLAQRKAVLPVCHRLLV